MTSAGDAPVRGVRALAFDVFGTLVDWRGSIARNAAALAKAWGKETDGEGLADAWRAEYGPAMDRVRRGEVPWKILDALHRNSLDVVAGRFGLAGIDEEQTTELVRLWHRLDPWPDAAAGLQRLRRRFIVTTLSNGNVALLVDLARHAAFTWDCVFSAELVRHYKPDPETYRSAHEFLGIAPSECMLVAAHNDDLRAAAKDGLRTAFVARPTEHGPAQSRDLSAEPFVEIAARDLVDLADRLGA